MSHGSLHQLRQLGDVGGDALGLVAREQVRGRAPSRLLLEIDVSELLSRAVLYDEASLGLIDGPGRREAAIGDDPLVEIEDEGAYVSSRVEGAQRGLIGR